VIGLQRFWLGWENQPVEETNYTTEQMQAMEAAARGFAEKHGFKTGELVSTNRVTGSFDTGCEMTFSLPDGRTVSVIVSVEGAVSGYSLVQGKG
jgi:Flp pilus assembly protein CpaB